ncbi:hypothetical protein BKP42_31560 [Rhodococcus erythropolis]|uniref:DUF6301 family protein n=1 Tax=Rhodococcus erythropolis TaxID=1833 RepID=UPI000BB3A05E|nr:DUF6301 family protein [Rhodococcus erythropolis]PBI97177.1 hypothetical protein BKP42_31560 [Rhodococcus erythropolis]
MHVDVEGAARIARLAAEFDWTWAVDDLEPFCAQDGWELVELDQNGASMRTGLRVGRPEPIMFGRNRTMRYISIFVSDVADDATPMTVVRPLLVEGFTNLDVAFTALLGTATSAEPEATIRWDLPKAVITLNRGVSAIHLHLKSPGYQAWADEPEPEYEDED